MAGTTIGGGIQIDGEVRGAEPLTIQGQVKGRIVLDGDVTLDPGSAVEADIEGKTVAVGGRLTGSVAARERVEVRADARMVGDIRSPRIAIADGASFKGNIDMDV